MDVMLLRAYMYVCFYDLSFDKTCIYMCVCVLKDN